jgi:hypothetical protein
MLYMRRTLFKDIFYLHIVIQVGMQLYQRYNVNICLHTSIVCYHVGWCTKNKRMIRIPKSLVYF